MGELAEYVAGKSLDAFINEFQVKTVSCKWDTSEAEKSLRLHVVHSKIYATQESHIINSYLTDLRGNCK